jgi:hypothetical protein
MPDKDSERLFGRLLTSGRLEGFLKDWEKARETPGYVFAPVPARNPAR